MAWTLISSWPALMVRVWVFTNMMNAWLEAPAIHLLSFQPIGTVLLFPYSFSQEANVNSKLIPFREKVAALSPDTQVIIPVHLEPFVVGVIERKFTRSTIENIPTTVLLIGFIRSLLSGIGLLTLASSAMAQEIAYSNRASYPISMEPFFTAGIAVGDIDGDGDLDMVEANGRHWPQANYVYLNADNRRLASRYKLEALERTAYAVKLADMNGDGHLDIVQASDKQQNQIFYGDGAGGFGAAHLFGNVGSNTRSITLADLNGDGAPDILEVCRGTPNQIFLNDGAGTPATDPIVFWWTWADRTLSVAVADMNDDGHVDLVLANRDGRDRTKFCLAMAN